MKITDIVDNIISKVNATTTHKNTTGNPHGTVFSDIGSKPTTVGGYGLTDVYTKTQNDTSLALKVNNSEKGVANGVATLDVNGKVVLTQIPDSVLGQLEYMGVHNFTTMPTATQKGQYWIASTSGNDYVVGDWAVWNGSTFDKVDNTDAVATVAGRTGNVVLTKSDVGLGSVDNTSDSAKPISTAQQTALDTKVSKVTSTDNAIVRFDGITGAVQNSAITIDDNGNIGSGTQSFNGFGGSGGFKNKVINGNFCINNYARLPFILTPTYTLYIDCFDGANSGTGTITVSADTIIHKGKSYDAIKTTATTAVSLGTDTRYYAHNTLLEAKNITEISTGDMCLSFLFECSRAGIYSVAILKYEADGTNINSSYVTSFTATIGSQKVIIPIPANSFKVPKSNLKGIAIHIGFVTNIANSITSVDGWNIGMKLMKQGSLEWANTIGAYIKLGNIQLEEGLIPSPYEYRLSQIEEILCFRYNKTIGVGAAWRTIGSGGTNNGAFLDITFELPNVMRASPTLTVLGALSSFQIVDGVTTYTPTAIYIQDVADSCVNIRCVYTGGIAGRLAKLMTINANSGIRLESAV